MRIPQNTLLILVTVGATLSSPTAYDARADSRIVNGDPVDITQVPYQASVRRRVFSGWTHTCGAVVISDRAILTAAHCVLNYASDPSSIRVVVGTVNRLSGGETYEISRIIVHESYSAMTYEHDIGMLVTSTTIRFDQTVNAVPIAPANLRVVPGSEALVSGFGTTSYEGSTSSVLLVATVNIIEQSLCVRAYVRLMSIKSGMLCAGASSPPRDACQGDSGGPLVANNYLIGLVSWGEGCAESAYPGVYTRISEYNTWINNYLAQI